MWWRMFDRHKTTVEERFEDRDCLAGLIRTERPTWTIKPLPGLRVPLRPGAGDQAPRRGQVLRRRQGVPCRDRRRWTRTRARWSSSPPANCPTSCRLIPEEHVGAKEIKAAVARYASAWERGEVASQAVDDLLRRRPPRIAGHDGGVLVGAGEIPLERLVALAPRLTAEHALHPGSAGHGKDLHGRGGDRGATAAWPPGRRHRAEPQGHPQSHGRCPRGDGSAGSIGPGLQGDGER